MYDRIANTRFTIRDGETGNYIGETYFSLPDPAEIAILNLINYNAVPDVILLTNVTLLNPGAGYTQPGVSEVKKRGSILTAMARDRNSKEWVPVKVRLKYDMMARGNLSGNIYFYDSMELGDIKVISVEQVQP
ncbi:hypothetical protein [Oscillibacter sp.]|uniref:hypothetical protein n=1 Tax=Oscillibacter sp. TaxID=1945593 RepID=UPI0028B21A9B|nr:hypothetical protein [Oscillibacter sp.]